MLIQGGLSLIPSPPSPKGGATVADLKAECRRCCTEAAPAAYAAYGGPDEALSRVFAQEPVEWLRVRDFQVSR